MKAVCYVCQGSCDRQVEVDKEIYVYLHAGNCEKMFWEVIMDFIQPPAA